MSAEAHLMNGVKPGKEAGRLPLRWLTGFEPRVAFAIGSVKYCLLVDGCFIAELSVEVE